MTYNTFLWVLYNLDLGLARDSKTHDMSTRIHEFTSKSRPHNLVHSTLHKCYFSGV